MEIAMNKAKVDIEMFGCLSEEIDTMILRADNMRLKTGSLELSVGILSDAQYMLENDEPERARKLINKAKYVILAYCDKVQSN
jgi:hypothetical protein